MGSHEVLKVARRIFCPDLEILSHLNCHSDTSYNAIHIEVGLPVRMHLLGRSYF
jgi:hypothetical protein